MKTVETPDSTKGACTSAHRYDRVPLAISVEPWPPPLVFAVVLLGLSGRGLAVLLLRLDILLGGGEILVAATLFGRQGHRIATRLRGLARIGFVGVGFERGVGAVLGDAWPSLAARVGAGRGGLVRAGGESRSPGKRHQAAWQARENQSPSRRELCRRSASSSLLIHVPN